MAWRPFGNWCNYLPGAPGLCRPAAAVVPRLAAASPVYWAAQLRSRGDRFRARRRHPTSRGEGSAWYPWRTVLPHVRGCRFRVTSGRAGSLRNVSRPQRERSAYSCHPRSFRPPRG
jgi:hypothetical protein